MAIEIVDVPINSMVMFHSSFVNVYQRVHHVVAKPAAPCRYPAFSGGGIPVDGKTSTSP